MRNLHDKCLSVICLLKSLFLLTIYHGFVLSGKANAWRSNKIITTTFEPVRQSCFIFVKKGVVSPDSSNPIVLERVNEAATSSYTFYMSLETRLVACKMKIFIFDEIISKKNSKTTIPKGDYSIKLLTIHKFTMKICWKSF